MTIDTSELMESFLDFSVAVTGFSRFELVGTGQADLYFKTVLKMIGQGILEELLTTFNDLQEKAQKAYKPAILTEGIDSEILVSGKLGPIARNIIKLWYISTWEKLPEEWHDLYDTNQEDKEDFIPAPQAYPEGLVWKSVGVNPPGANAPGYGTWSEPPSVSL